MNRERLLNVARACREAKTPEMFSMRRVKHPCGTPACALGQYAARPDLQSEFRLGNDTSCVAVTSGRYSYRRLCDHFQITEDDCDRLFGVWGCNDARLPIEAAEYIERFVATQAQS